MRDYFIRRFLLIPPTLLGVTLVVFLITRFAPGGPVEQAIMRAQAGEMGGGAAGRDLNRGALSEEQLERLKAYYGFDKPVVAAYFHWLGKVVQGDLGQSFRYGEPVSSVILARLPVSMSYGLISLVLVYTICLPLGIVKAIKHRTPMDTGSSILIFVGYSIPGYALGALLVVFVAARAGWFPMGGFVSADFEDLTLWGKVKDFVHHAVLPLTCYSIGSFAFLTLLVKNQLMDNLAADYVRTAVAKGVSFKNAVFKHAFRNSLIPVATNLGGALSALIGGSFLIEFIFDIDGMGLLGYNSVVDRDYQVVMGVLLLASLLLLIGNILADFLVALADPRVRFK
jgi:microcin C transport system permease protein